MPTLVTGRHNAAANEVTTPIRLPLRPATPSDRRPQERRDNNQSRPHSAASSPSGQLAATSRPSWPTRPPPPPFLNATPSHSPSPSLPCYPPFLYLSPTLLPLPHPDRGHRRDFDAPFTPISFFHLRPDPPSVGAPNNQNGRKGGEKRPKERLKRRRKEKEGEGGRGRKGKVGKDSGTC